jgi:DNA modification methylase
MSRLFVGDCRESLKNLINAGVKVQMCLTSPPYRSLRSYLPKDHVMKDREVGIEETLEDYITNLVDIFSLVKDLLNDDGVLWINIADTYVSSGGHTAAGKTGFLSKNKIQADARNIKHASIPKNMKIKDLMGIPHTLAFALRELGFFWRSECIWGKSVSGQKEITAQVLDACLEEGIDIETTNRIISKIDPYVGSCLPESVKDRFTKSHEFFFMFTKSQKYYFDMDLIKEPCSSLDPSKYTYRPNSVLISKEGRKEYSNKHKMSARSYSENGRNRRSVWCLPPRPSKISHTAMFPHNLIEPLILAGSRPGDLILDPFLGSGTVAGVCEKLGRLWVGCELNPEYADLVPKRIEEIKNGK